MVTTTASGMAVPDYPGTYGYNLLLYPWQTWLLGPWDIFIEHGHRLLAVLVGLIAIALLVATWKWDARPAVRWLAVATLLGVIFQGLLGGARVLLDEVQLARMHGYVGPAFFALCLTMSVVTSRWWREAAAGNTHSDSGNRTNPGKRAWDKLTRLALLTTGLVFLQIVVGAHLRHLPPDFAPGSFQVVVFFHLLLAGAVLVHGLLLLIRVLRHHRDEAGFHAPATMLALLMLGQVVLGCGAWVMKYSWPAMLGDFAFAAHFTVQAQSYWQAVVVTAHQATGSLILVATWWLALRGLRKTQFAPSRRAESGDQSNSLSLMEAIA